MPCYLQTLATTQREKNMLVSTLFVMLMSATPDAASSETHNECTNPLLSYTYDTVQRDGRTMVRCLICQDVATWRLLEVSGENRVVNRRISDISHLRGAVEQVQLGNIIESLDSGPDATTIFYWAHPSDGPAFLLTARQNAHIWNNDAAPTDTLVDIIDSVCSDQM